MARVDNGYYARDERKKERRGVQETTVRTTVSPLLIICIIFASAVVSCRMPANSVNDIPPNASAMTVHMIRLRPGKDLKRSVEDYVKTNDIEAAVILSCVGSLDEAYIRFANRPDATMIPGKLEITSLVGTLAKSSGSHIHMTVADGNGVARGGHLMDGSIVYTTAEIAIGHLPMVTFSREEDSTYGYHELVIHQRP
jgi:uncharacterized protein